MKRLLLLCLSVVTLFSAQAQNQTQGGSNAALDFFGKMDSSDYNRVYVGYNPVNLKWNDFDSLIGDALPFKNGLTVGYLHASNILKGVPLYIEYGGNLMYTFGRDSYSEEYDGDLYKEVTKANLFSVNVPVSLSLRLSFNDNKMSITPYLGLNFRVNLAGNLKYTYKERYYDYYDDVYVTDEDSYKVNLFDEDDMDDSAVKRFQIGFNCGVGFTYAKYSLGVGYTTDFSSLIKAGDEDFELKGKLNVVMISLGYNF